jgi:hypothetical protein
LCFQWRRFCFEHQLRVVARAMPRLYQHRLRRMRRWLHVALAIVPAAATISPPPSSARATSPFDRRGWQMRSFRRTAICGG